MKRLALIALIIVMVISIFSFSSLAADLKIAVLLPGPISDEGWNMIGYNALKAAEKKYGAEIAYTERTPVADYEEIFQGYAQAGFDIVWGHGFQFIDAATKVAPNFPKTIFAVATDLFCQPPNGCSLAIYEAQNGFMQGAIAAILTKTNKVGYIGGMGTSSIIKSKKGFEAGVRYISPDVEANNAIVGSFEDPVKAKEIAKAMAQKGVDIIVADADAGNVGIIEAAREEGIKIIGSSGDYGESYPDVVITSGVEDFPKVLSALVDDVLEGKFEPKIYEAGLREGAIRLAPFREYEKKISKEDMAKINQVVEDLKSEKIDLPKLLED